MFLIGLIADRKNIRRVNIHNFLYRRPRLELSNSDGCALLWWHTIDYANMRELERFYKLLNDERLKSTCQHLELQDRYALNLHDENMYL